MTFLISNSHIKNWIFIKIYLDKTPEEYNFLVKAKAHFQSHANALVAVEVEDAASNQLSYGRRVYSQIPLQIKKNEMGMIKNCAR